MHIWPSLLKCCNVPGSFQAFQRVCRQNCNACPSCRPMREIPAATNPPPRFSATCMSCMPSAPSTQPFQILSQFAVTCGMIFCKISSSIFNPVLVWKDAVIGPCPSVVIVLATDIGGPHADLFQLLAPAFRYQVSRWPSSDT